GRERLAVHARQLALQPHLQILRRSRRPLLCGMEQARRSALAHHVHRTAPMGPRVLINGIWYYTFATSSPLFTSISVTGAGIVNNSSNAPTFIVGNQANIFFRGASTAGNATIITSPGGLTGFVDSATGGNARFITLAGGAFDMTSLSSGVMTAEPRERA